MDRGLPRSKKLTGGAVSFEIWDSGELRPFTLVEHDRRYIGFDSMADIIFQHPEWMPPEGMRSRQWIVVKHEKVSLRATSGAFVFDPIELDVKTKKREVGPNGALHDVNRRARRQGTPEQPFPAGGTL